ncbi:hemolymph juvenile hormone binding protein (JHBP) [Popillia japonica]|uniref:Hemolymph juvenile hormone binding protein (JHBP) n=1 Tax=Popillia japonica TaxID=7064 RepID=A0AAW1LD05_POPJA
MRNILCILLLTVIFQDAISLSLTSNRTYYLKNVNPSYVPRFMEEELNNTLECFRYTFETGLPDYGIPSLVTVDIPELSIDPGAIGENSHGFFTGSGVLRGLTTFVSPEMTTTMSFDPVGFGFDVTLVFAELYLDLDYETDMVVEGIAAYGKGKIVIDWTDVMVRLRFLLGISDILYVGDVGIYLYIGGSQVTITGFFNDEEHSQVVTDLVNDYLIPNWINNQVDEISEVLSPLLESLLNSLFDSLESTADDGDEDGGFDLEAIFDAVAAHCEARETYNVYV